MQKYEIYDGDQSGRREERKSVSVSASMPKVNSPGPDVPKTSESPKRANEETPSKNLPALNDRVR